MDYLRTSEIRGGARHAHEKADAPEIDDGVLLELKYKAITAKGAAYCMFPSPINLRLCIRLVGRGCNLLLSGDAGFCESRQKMLYEMSILIGIDWSRSRGFMFFSHRLLPILFSDIVIQSPMWFCLLRKYYPFTSLSSALASSLPAPFQTSDG